MTHDVPEQVTEAADDQEVFPILFQKLSPEQRLERDRIRAEVATETPAGLRLAAAGALVVTGFFGLIDAASLVAQHGFIWHEIVTHAVTEYREKLYPLYEVSLGRLLSLFHLQLTDVGRDLLTLLGLGFAAANAESVLRSKATVWGAAREGLKLMARSRPPWREVYRFVVRYHVLGRAVGLGFAATIALGILIGVATFLILGAQVVVGLWSGDLWGLSVPRWIFWITVGLPAMGIGLGLIAAPMKLVGMLASSSTMWGFDVECLADDLFVAALMLLWPGYPVAAIVFLVGFFVGGGVQIPLMPLMILFCTILTAWRTTLSAALLFGLVMLTNTLVLAIQGFWLV